MTVIAPEYEDNDEEEVGDLVMPEAKDGADESMEVSPIDGPENAPTAAVEEETEPADDPLSNVFRWRIDNFSKIQERKLHSHPPFTVGGFNWRILLFPRGNQTDSLSIYLEVAEPNGLPVGWSKTAQFWLTLINQHDVGLSAKKEADHHFTRNESDWGFTQFMPLHELFDPSRGFLVNDAIIIEAVVNVRQDYWSYDSKKETGCVGLKNQGATCYMNSLLQTLYHIPYFRQAVYHMPTTEDDLPASSIPLALQSLFYKLQYTDGSVATKDLTKSFGWDTYDSFMQHDVQELNRVLCEKLEDKMKGTAVEGAISKLFEGHIMNYIECINVEYSSTRKDSFYDLQLDVRGCANVYDSFDKYVEVERLEGDNKYHAEQFGLQDAKKGVLFVDFPPVLQLQLKRFDYDFMRDAMVKINDRYEFPLTLDLDVGDRKYLSPDADKSVRNLYSLHSVLVHSGGVHGGHYYAFIRPTLGNQWLKFDDERVTKESAKRAMEEQYGGDDEILAANPGFKNTPPPFKFTKYSNAYMLVYIRDCDRDRILCKVDEADVAEHLKLRLRKEAEEKERKRKEKAEAHLYTILKIARDEDLTEQIGKDIFFDLVDFEKVQTFRVQKQKTFVEFKEEIQRELHIPINCQRFWTWASRQNHTFRPVAPLTPEEENMTVGEFRETLKSSLDIKLFLEGMPVTQENPAPLPPTPKVKENILLFFKFYDPVAEEMRYVGRHFVPAAAKSGDLHPRLREMAGLPPLEPIVLYEEIKFVPVVMCEPIDPKLTLFDCQIEDGDIVCIQQHLSPEKAAGLRFPAVPKFLEYVRTRQVVHFRRLDKPKEDEFTLELSKNHTYDDVVEHLAKQLSLPDPSKLRLTPHNSYSQQPKPPAIRYRGVDRLADMLSHYNQTSDILYFEVLDIPLPELQMLKTLKVAFHNSKTEEVMQLNIRLPKQSTMADVLADIKTRGVPLSSPDAPVRMLEVFYHKIYKVFPPTENIDGINDQYWTLRAEEVPPEELSLEGGSQVEEGEGEEGKKQLKRIHVYHMAKEQQQGQAVQNFGEPFFFVISESETLAEIKSRIRAKLEVPEEDFSKWKFAFVSLGKPEYLEDSDVVATRFQKKDTWEHYLGMEHVDSHPRRHHNHNRHSYEKPVKIYN